jgi:hypothetical protein
MNVGCVWYQKGAEPGTLTATWCHLTLGTGTGKATGGPAEGFVGHYHIRYYNDQGDEVAVLELDIQKKGKYYELSWVNCGEITAKGMGMEVVDGLVAGWRDTNDESSR